MKLFIVIELAEEFSAGSSPDLNIHAFTTAEKREEFISDWNLGNCRLEKDNAESNSYHSQGWSYWLEFREIEVDANMSRYDTSIIKRY